MRHDTLRFPVPFTVSMGPTSVCLCLHGEGVGSPWTQTQRHDVQGERKRTMNFSASSPLSCGEESIQSKSSNEKGGTEYPPTQSAESLPSCKGEGWGLPRLQEETNQEFKKKNGTPIVQKHTRKHRGVLHHRTAAQPRTFTTSQPE